MPGIRALAPLAHTLTHLDLGHANLTGEALRHVTSLTSLSTLCLSGSPLLTSHCVARVVRALPLLVRLEVPGCWLVPKTGLLGLLRRGSSGAMGAGSKAAAAAAVLGGGGLGTSAGIWRSAVGAAGTGAGQAAGGQLLAVVAPDGELLLFAEVAAAAAAAGVVAAAALSSGKVTLLGVPGSLPTISGAAMRGGSGRLHNSRSGVAGVAGVAAQMSTQQLEQYDERCRYTKQQLLELRPSGSPPLPFETTSEPGSQASAYTDLPDCDAASCDAGRARGAAAAGVARSSSDEGHASTQMLQMLNSTPPCPGSGGDGSQDSAAVRQAVASAAAELLT